MTDGATYAAAGVDIAAGDEAVERIKDVVASTTRPGVLGGIGGFGGMFELDLERYPHPVLVASTDGVGTKLEVARLAGRYDSVGIDLVAMCVDDLVCIGAEPLFLLDYIATGAVDPDRIEEVVSGIAEGCRQARCALLGGETAEHGGVMGVADLDLAGFSVGVVEKGTQIGPDQVVGGEVLIGIPSPGLRSNGYTLARHVLLEIAGLSLDDPAWDGATETLADELLRPSVVYAPAIVDALRDCPGAIHACAHITGGGIAGNLVRALPDAMMAIVDRSLIPVPRIFDEIARLGPVEASEMDRVFNLGVGMIVAVDPASADHVLASLVGSGHRAARIGTIEVGEAGAPEVIIR
ncbi:MAG: phosphoribosylformylglycinamidine cyclo-ligase [Actinomycetes bacterium]